jgi:hypothetical protein
MIEEFPVDKIVAGILVLVLLGLILVTMWLGWRARGQRQKKLSTQHAPPVDRGKAITTIDVMYVATTVAHDPLNRVAVGGLGFRARATLDVRNTGLWLQIPGQIDVFIPAKTINRVEKSTCTIDRVVEEGGMVLIAWILPSTDAVDTYVRVIDPNQPEKHIRSVQKLAGIDPLQNLTAHHDQGNKGDLGGNNA